MWSIYVETEFSSVCAACNRVDTPRRSGSCSLSRHSRCSRSSHSCPSGDCRRSEVAFRDTVPAPSAVCRQPWKLRKMTEEWEEGKAGMNLLSLISVRKLLLTHLSAAWHVHVSDSPNAERHSLRGTWPAAARVYASLSWFQSKFHFKNIYIYIYVFVQLAGILLTIWDLLLFLLFWFLFSYFFCQSRTNCLHRMFSIECAVGGIWQIFHSFLWGFSSCLVCARNRVLFLILLLLWFRVI